MGTVNIFAGCVNREQALKSLEYAKELGIATPDDELVFELVFGESLPESAEITPSDIKYSVFLGHLSQIEAEEKLHRLDGHIFSGKIYHQKSDIEQEQVAVLAMLRRDFSDVKSLQVIVLGNWVWIDKSSSLPRNVQLRLENCGFKFHAQRDRHYWKSKRERSRFARRMSNAELDNKYSSK